MSGTDPTYEVLRIRRERAVSAVALDPRSPAATALRPLTDASGRSMAGPGAPGGGLSGDAFRGATKSECRHPSPRRLACAR